jgi:hypothetical protein
VISGAGDFLFSIILHNHRIIATRMKRVAFYKPYRCQITPFEKTIGIKSLFRISGTARVKTAVIA